jgi:hypothetical protein
MKNMYELFFIFSFMFILNMPSVAEKNNSQFLTDQTYEGWICNCGIEKQCGSKLGQACFAGVVREGWLCKRTCGTNGWGPGVISKVACSNPC